MFSIVECVISALIDEFRQKIGSKRNILYFRIFIVITSFILGLPMVCKGGIYLLNLIDFSVGGLPLLLIGFIELVALNWIYGFEDFWCDIVMMIGEKPKLYWKVCWTVVSPVVIFATILFNIIYYKEPGSKDNPYPGWALALGWLITLFPVAVVPAWFIYKYCTEGGWQLLKLRSAPLPTWGPALATNRIERYEARESQPPATGPRFDLLTVTRPEEFLRLMAGSTSTLNTGSSLTINTNVGSMFGSKSSV